MSLFEVVTPQASFWKKLVDSMKELVGDTNFQCNPAGISIQAMDSAHVALVHLMLKGTKTQEGGLFDTFNCHRTMVMGVSLNSLSKILKTVDGNDTLTFRTDPDAADSMTILSNNKSNTRASEFQLRLMEIEAEAMQLPDMDYVCQVSMSSSDFAKVCRDMSVFGDTVTVTVSRAGIRFGAQTDFAEGSSFFKAANFADSKVKTEKNVKAEPKVKEEVPSNKLKSETKAEPVDDAAAPPSPAAVKSVSMVKGEPEDDEKPFFTATKKEGKKGKDEEKDSEADAVRIEKLEGDVSLAFALRYFNVFSKACTMTERVHLHMATDQPCMIEFPLNESGSLRYYLAPKVDAAE